MTAISYTVSDFVNKISSSNNSYIYSYSKRVREADADVQDFQDEVESFRKNIRNLKNYDSEHFDKDKIKKQLSSYVESYNSMKSATSATQNTEISAQLEKLDEVFEDNAKNFKTLGIKLSDGKLKFDTDTFDDVTDKEAKEICDELFKGSDSFIAKLYKSGRTLEKTADEEEYHINLRQLHTTTVYTDEQIAAVTNAASLKSLLSACENAETSDEKKEAVKNYVQGYQSLQSAELEETYTDKMNALQTGNQEALSEVGIIWSDDNMSYNEETSLNESTYEAIFDEASEYAASMNNLCNQIIQSNLKADKLGITLDLTV